MALKLNRRLTARALLPQLQRLFELSGEKVVSLQRRPAQGTPVYTIKGRYTSRGWTEWTQGFQFGSALLQFDATGEQSFLELGRRDTIEHMAGHVSHTGVHDHGFNNISTYGNLWRLMREGKLPFNPLEQKFYQLALKVSGAVQAARWTTTDDGGGFIYSFNGPHSLFIDTMRSLRSLAVAHQLGHALMGERDRRISLLQRLLQHAATTARYNIYYGAGRDAYDLPGRTAHEAIFDVLDGSYRSPNSQQGYSPFSTWTRGLAWAILGFAEQLEFLETLDPAEMKAALNQKPRGGGQNLPGFRQRKARTAWPEVSGMKTLFMRAARATADFYLAHSCADGIPMWDTGAPNLHRLGDFASQPANPFNPWEPVDSSAAAIAAQGLLRLGRYFQLNKDAKSGTRYRQAALTVADTLFREPYLSTNPKHQGLLLHSVYHRPNGWDYVPQGAKVPRGESSMWGDYHLRELALLLWREARTEPYLTFYADAPRGAAV